MRQGRNSVVLGRCSTERFRRDLYSHGRQEAVQEVSGALCMRSDLEGFGNELDELDLHALKDGIVD